VHHNAVSVFGADYRSGYYFSDIEIKNMARLMDFGSWKDWKNNNGNTYNTGWPTV